MEIYIQTCGWCEKYLPIYDNDMCVDCYEEGVEEDDADPVATDGEGYS